jgi:multidrug resistance efflux pump
VLTLGFLLALPGAAQPQDGGTPRATDAALAQQSQRIDQLTRELQDLRAQLALAAAQAEQNEQMLARLDQLNAQVAGVQQQIVDARVQQQQRVADVNQAIAEIIDCDEQLIYGDETNVDARLAHAASVLDPPASQDVQAARGMLANRDIANTRLALFQALDDARRAQGR